MINLVARIIVFLFLPFLTYGFGKSIYDLAATGNWRSVNTISFVIGFALFALIWLLIGRFLQVICTFEHELTHLIVGLLFLKVPKSFNVTFSKGGYVEMYGGRNFLVTLAPYFLPTICYFLIPLSWFLKGENLVIYFGVFGAATAFHLFSGWQEFHLEQSDLHDAGLFFSILFLPVANLIFFGAIAALLLGGNESFIGFWKNGLLNSVDFFRTTASHIVQVLR